ncbi:WAT1-related protein At2g37450 [Gossypium hirsutum]|uniref:WAT1-related protein At2g37450 n=1 Tax=Gossypium hirsutum TaxID=3635 RepID=A0ABM2Z3B8_GOSHI|nr:WAT1-related protein At2g37450-like [Gossypium hirsutum]
MSHFVLVVYSNALASLILLPVAFFFTRFNLMQNCVIIGVRYSFPTLASALANLISAFTFLLAVIFRFICCYAICFCSIRHNQLSLIFATMPILSPRIQSHLHPSHSTMLTISNNWLISGLFIATVCLSLSVKIVGQAAVLKGYPSEITLVSFYCLFGSIQSALVTLILKETQTLGC